MTKIKSKTEGLGNPRIAKMIKSDEQHLGQVTASVIFVSAWDVLLEAKNCFESLYKARAKRERHKRYAFGEDNGQWSDLMEGLKITEAQHISNQGKTPLQYNLIGSSMVTVLGQYVNSRNKPVATAIDRDESKAGEMMTAAIEAAYSTNQILGIDTEMMLETLISGVSIGKVRFGFNPVTQRTDVITENKNITRMFFNPMEDPRNWDCNIIGEIHDMSLAEVMDYFGDGSPRRMKEIRDLYSVCTPINLSTMWGNLTQDRRILYDFLTPYDPHFCRVIEIWRLESAMQYKCHDMLTGDYFWTPMDQRANIEAENQKRTVEAERFGIIPRLIDYTPGVHRYWYFRFMTPHGKVLKEGESPYWHKSHPYAMRRYFGIEGGSHSFVELMIDAQRMLNRNISLMDFIIGGSAKGVLAIAEDTIPDGWTPEMFAENYRRVGSYLLYKPNNTSPDGGVPKEIKSNSSNIGASEMVGLIRSLLPDISGVHGALQGKQANSGTSGVLYQAEAEQAATNLVYIFDTFNNGYRLDRDKKVMQVIQQYYDTPTYLGIVGNDFSEESKAYDPKKVQNVDFDLSLGENTNTATYKNMMNQMLLELFKMQVISAKNMLSNSSLPFKDRVLQSMEADEREAKQIQETLQAQGQVPLMQPFQQTA